MSSYHTELMLKAIDIAYQGIKSGAGGPFGAVVSNENGQILSMAHNEVLKTNDPTAHAEIQAIRALRSFSLPNVTLYATGYPCPMCLSALLWARIPTIYYCNDYTMAKEIGFDDEVFMLTLGEIYQCKTVFSKESHTKRINIHHLPLTEGQALYDYWLSQDHKTY